MMMFTWIEFIHNDLKTVFYMYMQNFRVGSRPTFQTRTRPVGSGRVQVPLEKVDPNPNPNRSTLKVDPVFFTQ
jgi:hypothetical protein